MKNLRKQKGITLVALIITIIVLLILAVVTIAAVSGDGILSHAENARDKYTKAQNEENSTLKSYEDYLDQQVGKAGGDNQSNPDTKVSLATAKTAGTVFEKDTTVEDEFGNTLKVPAGFKIASDSATNVTGGVVIEDAIEGAATNGSQFVWIPVGTVYTAANKASSETITLSRYTFASDGTPTDQGETTIDTYFQELATSDKGNATAKNLTAFKSSVTSNGGYYMGRYEARTNSTTARANASRGDISAAVTCKSTNAVYNYVTQPQASTLSQGMYTGKTFTSDLINSYAWDTAIVFIQKFSGNSNYANAKDGNGTLVTTGTPNDTVCKINGMASNCLEWTTETYTDASSPCTYRGGSYSIYFEYYTSSRDYGGTTGSSDVIGFRPLLYW